MGQVIDGVAVARALRERVGVAAAEFAARTGRAPRLDVILVGEDPASAVYVSNKAKACEAAGMRGAVHRLSAGTTQPELLAEIAALQSQADLDGLLVQLPLPRHIDESAVIEALDPARDVDGFHALNAGALFVGRPGLVPCTPTGCMRLLDHVGVALEGSRALVIGRSNIVGKPMAMLLLARSATVTVAHSRTRDLAERVAESDVVVAAVGRARFVRGEWIKPGATVIDVGINRDAQGKLCGDVDLATAIERAGFITPVPGGVGPMTIACLLENTVRAAWRRAGLEPSALAI
ncbi:MAG: bifunctional 5,10-methylenetetrahydrofolate dehydrogenase/5,10-methenyltetrahydrofolate cyclohydrolase [Polyangiales bacterium]